MGLSQGDKGALPSQPEWCRVALASISDAVITTDAEGRVTFLNSVAESLTGWALPEAAGQALDSVLRIIDDESRQTVENTAARGLRDGVFAGPANDTLLVAKDGRERPIDQSATPIHNEKGEVVGALLVFRDTTERRSHERVAQQALAYADDIIATLREPFLVLDRDLRVKTANGAFYETFHVSKEDTVNRLVYDLGDGQWDVPRLRTLLREVVSYNHPVHDFEVEHDFPTIGHRSMLLNARKFPPESINPDMILLAIEDVTVLRDAEANQSLRVEAAERERRERELQEHAAELERRVKERTSELQEANAALEVFGFSVSHDLRTPLRNVQSLAQALVEDCGDRLDAGGRDFCRRIIDAVRKMDTLINDLLAYSRLSRSDLPLARVDLNEMLAEVQAALANVIREGQAEVEVQGPLPPVMAHHLTLVQIVTNLVTNAVKFVAPGVRAKVRVRAEDVGEWVRLWVEDNGLGISPEHQQRIFSVFERLHGEESYPGTGIGLAIVRKGVERMGGRAGVESEVGQGSRFWLNLPKPG